MDDNTSYQEGQLPPEDLTPHSKHNLTSRIGRFVDGTTYLDLLLFAGIILLASSFWFWLAPERMGVGASGAGVTASKVSFFDSVYFVIVTFTSLGYGDFVPHGFGRFVAISDVLSGLGLIAVLIGKMSSERQASILILLHTSDTQRRISDFARELKVLRNDIVRTESIRDVRGLNESLKSHYRLLGAIANYLAFNSHQASVVQFGNFTALTTLYEEIWEAFRLFSKILESANKFGDAGTMRTSFLNMSYIHRIVKRMSLLHQHAKVREAIWRKFLRRLHVMAAVTVSPTEQSIRIRLKLFEKRMAENITEIRPWFEKGRHPIQIERVYKAFPAGPQSDWPTGITKVVAKQLGISNSVAGKCVNDLVHANRLPKFLGLSCKHQREQTDDIIS